MPDTLSADGRIVRLETVQPDDADQLLRLYHEAGELSRHLRFFSLGRPPIDAEVARLTRPAGADHHAVIAFSGSRAIGVASYERLTPPDEADFAVLVADDWQGHGVGTLLIEELARHARRHGIRHLLADVLPINTGMLRVAASINSHTTIRRTPDVDLIRLTTEFDEPALTALFQREAIAEEHSLRPLLAPRSIAVVGPADIEAELIDVLSRYGYTGRIATLVEPVDLVLISPSARPVTELIDAASQAGARAAIVLPAQPGDSTPQDLGPIVRIARERGIRVLGPNSLGVINTDPAGRMFATVPSVAAVASVAALCPPDLDSDRQTEAPARHGGLAVATQSGAVGVTVLGQAAQTGLGISAFVSLGDKADVSCNDLLSYWFDDPTTRAIALYLESFGNPRRFARIARAVGRRKPVLAVAAVQPQTIVESLFAQAGVIRAQTLGELLDAARLLVDQPLPAGDRVGVIANSSGLRTLAAEAAAAHGLKVVDVSSITEPSEAALRRMANAGEVDAVTINLDAATGRSPNLAAIADALDEFGDLTAVLVVVGLAHGPTQFGRRRAPVYPLPEPAVLALAHAVRYARWREQPLGSRPDLSDLDRGSADSIVASALAGATEAGDAGWQSASVVADLLACYGVSVAARPADVGEGLELVAGIEHHPLFGSLLTLGVRGAPADLLGDRGYQLLPVTDIDARALWRRLRAAPLLTGFGGAQPVDTAALESVLLRLGRLAEDFPEIAQLSLNPLVVSAHGAFVVAASLRLAPIGPEPDALARTLR